MELQELKLKELKLLELELYNFISYQGLHRLSFVSSDDQEKLSTIHGDSGLGKTALYRAIAAAIFADAMIRQKDIGCFQICNENALSSANGNVVDSYVKLSFTQHGKRYSIKRTFRSIRCENGKLNQDMVSHELVIAHGEEKQTIMDPLEINKIINPLVQLRDYILFNGERVERLEGKIPNEQQKEVIEGIRTLLGFNKVEKSLKSLNQLTEGFQEEISKLPQSRLYETKIQQLKDRSRELEEKKTGLKELKSLIGLRKEMTKKYDKELEEIDAIKDSIALREQLKIRLEEQKKQKEKLLGECGLLNGQAAFLLAEGCFHSVRESADKITGGVDLPRDVTIHLLEHIISRGSCPVCTNGVHQESEQMEYVLSLAEKIRENPGIIDIKGFTEVITKQIEMIQIGRSKIMEQLQRYRDSRLEVKRIENELETLYEKLGEKKEFKLSVKIAERDRVLLDLTRLQAQFEQLEEELPALEKQVRSLEQEKCNLEDKIAVVNIKMRMKSLTERAYKALQAIHDHFVENMRSKLEREATDVIRRLQGNASDPALKRVIIKPDFSLDVENWVTNPFVPNISEGQREILALTYMLALHEVLCGDGEKTALPMVMDSALMRFSDNIKEKLLRYMLEKTTQTILLVTDSEITNSHLDILRRSGKWGNAYRLVSAGNGNTNIIKENPLTFKL